MRLLPLAAMLVVPALVFGQRPGRDRQPSLDGIWNSATTTPIERPVALKDKTVLYAGGSGTVGSRDGETERGPSAGAGARGSRHRHL